MKLLLIVFLIFFIYNILKVNENFENFNQDKQKWVDDNLDILYINLDKSTERREGMEKQLIEKKFNFQRFPAIFGKNIDKNWNNILTRTFKTIDFNGDIYLKKKGSLGNYISQLTCWYNFYKNSQKKYLMIMEDDIILNDEFKKEVIFDNIKNLEGNEWSMLKFFCFDRREGTKYKNLVKAKCNKINYRAQRNTGMQCYIVNKDTVLKLIKDLLPIGNDTFDWKVKYVMMKHDIYITDKNFMETPEHNTQSDRKFIDKN